MLFDELLEQAENNQGLDGLNETNNLDNVKTSVINVNAEIRNDIPGFNGSEVIVTGAPFEAAGYLDSVQGDNIYGFWGDCGLTSIANTLTLCGYEITEDEVVEFAANNGLCMYDPEDSQESWGGTNVLEREEILEAYGVNATIFSPEEYEGSPEGIAAAVEEGRVVTISVNAGYLWDEAECVDSGGNNHVVTVTGTVRDPETGELSGFVICDSGRGLESDSCRVITLDEFDDCYTNVYGASALITDDIYRAPLEV